MTHTRTGLSAQDMPAENERRCIEVDSKPYLLIHDVHGRRALSATCPHAGAPLAEAPMQGDRLICPWHKAVFCLRTGRVLEPPAVDPLHVRPVFIEDDSITLGEAETPVPKPALGSGDQRRFVIIGAGAAGAAAAQTLREHGFAGEVLLLDDRNRVPYDRTVLSKYHISGEEGAEKSPLQPQSWWREHGVRRRTATVEHIDPAARLIRCAGGDTVNYDAALVATGAHAVRPDLPGADLPQVFTLRSIADADAILAAAEASESAAILGSSFIAMEVAAALRERGLDVTVVATEIPFASRLGEEVGRAMMRLHERKGVRFRIGRLAASIGGDKVTLDNGEMVRADLTIIGFGVRPATALLSGLPLRKDGGVLVDAGMRAGKALWAAGDIAAFPLHGDGPPTRVEHWRVAQQHGRIAALSMLGQEVPYTAAPVFWTIHYKKRLDYIGHAEEWDDLVLHGYAEKPEFLAYYVRNGEVSAATGIDRDEDTAALALLMSERRWRPEELGDQPARLLKQQR